MKNPILLTLLFVLVAVIISVAFWMLINQPEPEAISIPKQEEISTAVAPPPIQEPIQPHLIEPEEQEDLDPAWSEKPAAPPYMAGRILEKSSKEPIKAFHLEMSREENDGTWKPVFYRTVGDPEGRFLIPLEQSGRYRLQVRSSKHCPLDLEPIYFSATQTINDREILLSSGHSLVGRVLEEATGRPVQGALIKPVQDITPDQLLKLRQGYTGYCVHTKSDRNGLFRLSGLEKGKFNPSRTGVENLLIAALHPDFAEGYVQVTPGEPQIEIRLKTGFQAYGTVYDREGEPLAGVMIQMMGPNHPLARPVYSGSDGKYCTPPAPLGRLILYAVPDSADENAASRFQHETRVILIKDQDVEVNFGVGAAE